MAIIIEENELEEIQQKVISLEKDFKRQSDKINAIIDAIRESFDETREDDKEGVPRVDEDLYLMDKDSAESKLRNMVIDNLQYKIMEKINKVREYYKILE